jgi:hypothetical protein
MRKTFPGCRRHFILLAFFASTFSIHRTEAQLAPVYVYGAEPIYVPSEMPAVNRTWHPTDQVQEAGIKQGPPFEAALVRVFNEDTRWSSEMAVFRFRDGSVRAWNSRSFSPEDVKVMHEMKAKSAVPPTDARTWITKMDDQLQKLVNEKTVNKYETRHFAFIWGMNPDAEVKEALDSPQFIEKTGEWFEKVWTAYEVDFRAPMPHAGEPRPQRIVVKLYHTGIPNMGNSWANSADAMALDPRGMLYGSVVIAHEFCHVVQFYSGGFRIRPSVGPWWETHAENGSFNYSPTYDDKFPLMFAHLTHGCQWPESRYSNWAILMQLWEKKRTQHLVFGVWTKNRRDKDGASLEDPIETTVRAGQADRSLPKGWESFNEEVGEMAARMVTMDYINQGYLCDVTVDQRKRTMSKVMPDETARGWFKSPEDKKMYAYGIQWISVTPDPGARLFSVSFCGRSKANDARWRLTLVAAGKNNVARYSPRVTAIGKTEVKLGIPVKPGEEYVLAVAATPTKYRSLTWDQTPEFDYPYAVRAFGASFPVASLTPNP